MEYTQYKNVFIIGNVFRGHRISWAVKSSMYSYYEYIHIFDKLHIRQKDMNKYDEFESNRCMNTTPFV